MSPDERQPAPAFSSDDLARERTLMALDRTQMAWIRTGLSMLTFGFSLLKFFQFLRGQEVQRGLVMHGPRKLGLAIMTLGFVALSMATWQYVYERRRLHGGPLRQSPAFLVALFLIGLQGLALILSFMGR
jgi:putative membrane protein